MRGKMKSNIVISSIENFKEINNKLSILNQNCNKIETVNNSIDSTIYESNKNDVTTKKDNE